MNEYFKRPVGVAWSKSVSEDFFKITESLFSARWVEGATSLLIQNDVEVEA